MATKDPEGNWNSETEQEMTALKKKRPTRVSFAETTANRTFDREAEHETPPDPKPSSDGDQSLGQLSNETVGRCRIKSNVMMDFCSDEKGGGRDVDDDDEDEAVKRSFLRNIGSPSPGSTIGSAISNDGKPLVLGLDYYPCLQ
ncbi:hypothetical protein Nepgr_000605 [Nepenthes gracilis]|uniref:Uncharacterized protein n=1 Tax=Nepenthes gracilis TaxID=150966 RepID=A0AAD3P392_NEPGR|nr:hypothetical protein Nepgr_000605 [Nepenthes gracilis]